MFAFLSNFFLNLRLFVSTVKIRVPQAAIWRSSQSGVAETLSKDSGEVGSSLVLAGHL